MSILFTVLAALSMATAFGAAIYGAWCMHQARRYARADVPTWKLWSSWAATYEYYHKPGQIWVERAGLAQALMPLGFFGAIAFYALAGRL